MTVKLSDNSDELRKAFQRLGGGTWAEIFSDAFMRQYTDFQTFKEMSDTITSEGVQLEAATLDPFVNARTRFSNWDEMKKAAASEYGQ